jgi:hypothetical protein
MKMRTTAVEWLVEWMGKNQYFIGNDLLKAVEQAKEMEKKQLNESMNYDRPFLCCWEDNSAFEEYYKETFKK